MVRSELFREVLSTETLALASKIPPGRCANLTLWAGLLEELIPRKKNRLSWKELSRLHKTMTDLFARARRDDFPPKVRSYGFLPAVIFVAMTKTTADKGRNYTLLAKHIRQLLDAEQLTAFVAFSALRHYAWIYAQEGLTDELDRALNLLLFTFSLIAGDRNRLDSVKAISKKGAAARKAKYEPLKIMALEKASQRPYPSRRRAALSIAQEIITSSHAQGVNLSSDQAERTISKWLKEGGFSATQLTPARKG